MTDDKYLENHEYEMVKGGIRYYGQTVGIILYDTMAPRFLGDVGYANTFDFPVRLKYVEGLKGKWIVKKNPDPQALPFLIKAAKELESEGAKAVTTSCGFTVAFQKEIAEAVTIPVITSSLVQVPMVYMMLGNKQKIGIITANSEELGEDHLEAAGIDDSIPLIVKGIQDGPEWRRREEEMKVYPQKLTKEIVEVAKDLVSSDSKIGAIVLECTQLPSFAFAIQRETKLPVFDIYTLTKMVHEALFRNSFG